jgi:hypothetical protein
MNMYKWPALRLAFVPGIIEAVFDAGLGVALFGMPFTLALSMGFILKAVGPGLVVPAMFVLQKEGWGAEKGEIPGSGGLGGRRGCRALPRFCRGGGAAAGPRARPPPGPAPTPTSPLTNRAHPLPAGVPSTVVIAASFDDIIAITGFSVFINVAIAGGDNAAWQIASGPLQVWLGARLAAWRSAAGAGYRAPAPPRPLRCPTPLNPPTPPYRPRRAGHLWHPGRHAGRPHPGLHPRLEQQVQAPHQHLRRGCGGGRGAASAAGALAPPS